MIESFEKSWAQNPKSLPDWPRLHLEHTYAAFLWRPFSQKLFEALDQVGRSVPGINWEKALFSWGTDGNRGI
jgi:hypothetical protein